MAIKGKISEYFDFEAFQAEKIKVKDGIAEFIAEINKGASIKIKFPNLAEKSSEVIKNTEAMTGAYKRSAESAGQVVDAQKNINSQVKQTQLELLEARKRNVEISTELKQQQLEQRKLTAETKARNAEDKKAAAESLEAGREKIALLRQQAEAQQKLTDDLEARSKAEQQVLSGTYNPGGGKGNTPLPPAPLKLTVNQGDILLLKQYQAEVLKLNQEIKNASDAFKRNEISQSSYKKTIVEATEKINVYKKNISDLSREIKLNNDVNLAERNSLERARALILQYTNAKKTLNVATEDGRRLNESYNKAIAGANAFLLKNADAETQRTKNIGNYGSALNKILGPIRTLANILPGIGLSGIFLAAFEGLKYLADELGLFNSKLSQTQRQREILNKLNEDAAQSAGKEAGQLKILRAEIEGTSVPMATRLQAIKDLKKEYPDYFKGLTNEQILTGQVGNAYDLAAAAILRKAKAQAAASQIEANSVKELKILQEDLKDSQETNQKLSSTAGKNTVDEFGNVIDVTKQTNTLLKDAFTYRQNQRKQEVNDLRQDNDFLLKFAVDGAKEIVKIDKIKADTSRQSTKAALDSDFELYKIAQERKIKLLDEGANDEKNSYGLQLAYLTTASVARLELIDKTEQEELRKNDEKEKALQANYRKAKGTERNNLKIEITNNETARNIIEAKFENDRLNAYDDSEKKLTAIKERENQRRLKIQKQQYDNVLKAIEDEKNAEKAALENDYGEASVALEERYANGLLSQKKYNKKRLDLDFSYSLASLEIEADRIRKLITARALLGQNVSAELEALAKLEKEIAFATLKQTKAINKEKYDDILQFLGKVKQTSTEVFGFIDGILGANATKEKNKLKEQSDEAEKKAARDIEIVNAQSISEQDKAAKILVINSKLQAQKDQIAQKEKKADEDRTKFQKEAAIFNIILATTESVIKAYRDGGSLAEKIEGAVLAGAAGAAELAVAIATPIPQYKDGTAFHPGGIAEVGDGYRKEMIVGPDGKISITPDRPTIIDIPKGSKIFPDAHKIVRAVLADQMSQHLAATDNNAKVDTFPIDRFDKIMKNHDKHVTAGSKEIVAAINKKFSDQSGYNRMFGRGDNQSDYFKKNLQ